MNPKLRQLQQDLEARTALPPDSPWGVARTQGELTGREAGTPADVTF